jgi:hypothetical protein
MKKAASYVAASLMTLSMALPMVAAAQKPTLTADDLGVDVIENNIALGGGDVREMASNIINVALGFLGILSVIIVLMGGFKYMVSGGEEKKVEDAKKLIISGIIGLAIILSAWAITSFVISNLLTATGAGA